MKGSSPELTASESTAYRMPAEWEQHEATWLAWPHNPTDWPGNLGIMHAVYVHLVERLAASETVRIVVNSALHEKRARRYLKHVPIDEHRVEFYRFPTDRAWIRDYGPLFVRHPETGELAIANFTFNGWARYPAHHKDNLIPKRVAERFDLPLLPVTEEKPVVLEGGSIDHNGQGTFLTTEECLLDQTRQVRNPWMGRGDLEKVLGEYLGAQHVIWLGAGIMGDDTHGHVDDVCRFTGPRTLVYALEDNAKDINYRALKENEERLQEARLADGSKPECVPLPMPLPAFYDGHRLPASYANFYIANNMVLVPTFNDPSDQEALGILSELFTDRQVIGFYALDLVWGLGAIHCITQQQPVP